MLIRTINGTLTHNVPQVYLVRDFTDEINLKTKIMNTEKSDLENDNPALNKPNVGRSFTNVFVEIDGKPIPIRELPKIEYEEFLEGMHRLRLAYIAVVGR